MNTNAFTNGTLTWRQLDHIIDWIASDIDNELVDMTRDEKLYILGALDDCVSNMQYDLAPKDYTDRVLPFPLVEPPTPMFCDHCGEPVVCDNREPLKGEVGSFVHLSGYFGCQSVADTATVNGKQCLYRTQPVTAANALENEVSFTDRFFG